MSFRKHFISKSPFLQVGDPLKDLMNKLYTTSASSSNYNNSSNKGFIINIIQMKKK